jgi:anti-anti-sigma factor
MSDFNFKAYKQLDGVTVVKFAGIMDVFTLAAFMKYFKSLCNNPEEAMVVLDLADVDYIASSGWSVLLAGHRASQRHGGGISIFGLNNGIRREYEAMHLESLLPLAESFENAQMLVKMNVISKATPKPFISKSSGEQSSDIAA